MTVSDEDLARAKNISVAQVRLLRESRGTTNETLEVLPDAAVRHALQRLAYPDRPALRTEFRFRQALGDDGAEPPVQQAVETAVTELYVAAVADAPAQTAGVPTGSAGAAAGGAAAEAGLSVAAWEWLGPGNIGGRIRGIVIDPGHPSRMWAASVGGGVWHTQDGGATWATVDDFLGNLACTCIAMDPSDHLTIYAGTGEGFGNVDAIAGNGIFATSDGVTWAVLPATRVPEFTYVNRIAVTPSGVMLAATNNGLFRSADAGRANWTQVLSARVADVKFDPRDNGCAVAGGGTAVPGGGHGGEVWCTTDGGLTWTAADHGTPWWGRVELAYAAKNPDIVYASVQMTSGALWRSEDGGASYQPRQTHALDGSAAQYLGAQGWYGNAIWAGDLTDENLLIVGGINLWRSTDGGDTLTEISTWWAHPPSPHADQHAIVAHPSYDGTSNRMVFFGSDGGVCAAQDLEAVGREAQPPYQSGWTGLDNSFGVTQFYAGAGNTGSGKIIGGAQDNGTLCFDPHQGPQTWTTIFGGDGGWCASDPTDPDVFYGEYVYLNIHRNTDGGASQDRQGDRYISGQFFNEANKKWDWKPVPYSIPDAMPPPTGKRPKALFIAPFVLDPNEPDRVLAGGLSLWRTNDAKTPNTPRTGPSWQSIKDPIGTPDTRGFEISALAVAAGDSDTIWVGHANGAVFRTNDGTAGSPTWQPVEAAPFPPPRYCTRVTVHPGLKDVVYVAFGGYTRGNLWVTRDGGTTWSDLSSTLPTTPVRAVTVHPRRAELVYAGTEVGLFASEDSGTTWSPTNDGPTNCSVDDLFWMGETLTSVTHGRGMYHIDLSSV
jgi:photosystem II stability/assembly factor-like uncharacterized protein